MFTTYNNGDILNSIIQMLSIYQSGAVNVSALISKLDYLKDNLNKTFSELYTSLRNIQTDNDLFSDAYIVEMERKISVISNCEKLIQGGLDLIGYYYDIDQPNLIQNALFLIEHGETEFSAIINKLKQNEVYPLSSLSIGGDLFADIAQLYINEKIMKNDYEKIIEEYSRETIEYIDTGKDSFLEAINLLKNLEFNDSKVLIEASEKLQDATNQIMKALANIYQEPVKDS